MVANTAPSHHLRPFTRLDTVSRMWRSTKENRAPFQSSRTHPINAPRGDCASIGILTGRILRAIMWLELGLRLQKCKRLWTQAHIRHCELISSAVRLARMEAFLSAFRGSSTQAYKYNCVRHNGDNAIVSRQAVHVPDVPARKHCAEVQDSAAEGIPEEDDVQPCWRAIPWRQKAEGTVGPGEVWTCSPSSHCFSSCQLFSSLESKFLDVVRQPPKTQSQTFITRSMPAMSAISFMTCTITHSRRPSR
jgi:hypothetical protein